MHPNRGSGPVGSNQGRPPSLLETGSDTPLRGRRASRLYVDRLCKVAGGQPFRVMTLLSGCCSTMPGWPSTPEAPGPAELRSAKTTLERRLVLFDQEVKGEVHIAHRDAHLFGVRFKDNISPRTSISLESPVQLSRDARSYSKLLPARGCARSARSRHRRRTRSSASSISPASRFASRSVFRDFRQPARLVGVATKGFCSSKLFVDAGKPAAISAAKARYGVEVAPRCGTHADALGPLAAQAEAPCGLSSDT